MLLARLRAPFPAVLGFGGGVGGADGGSGEAYDGNVIGLEERSGVVAGEELSEDPAPIGLELTAPRRDPGLNEPGPEVQTLGH